MRRPAPYPAISRGPRGSYEWAMDQLRAGNEVRREHWPIEIMAWPNNGGPGGITEINYSTEIWHLYLTSWDGTICKGFHTGVVGADNDAWGDLGTDSGCWSPTVDDSMALDWQLVAEVGPEQIEWLDTHRMTRHPNEAIVAYERRRPNRMPAVLAVVAVAILGVLGWATITGRIPW